MSPMAYRRVAVLALLSANLILISCSGNNAPEPGTPAFYWSAAKETYNAGDYQKTVENLGNILSSQNEYVARAKPWMLVLTSGMSKGYMDLANAFNAGSKTNRTQATAFHVQVNDYQRLASTLAMQFAETFGSFNSKDDYVNLDFPYPTGSPTEVTLLTKVASGVMPAAGEVDTAQKRTIERAVLLTTCRAVGAPDDPAKAQDLLKTGNAKVPRAAFVAAMAAALFEESQIYGRDKLDDPDKMKIFCTRAEDALKLVPASKETEDLDKRIQTALKKSKV
jgi:hypothetical protein